MATETDHLHHHRQSNRSYRSCPDLLSVREDMQDMSISQILDHGSISFGRYATETLSWEKYSVFTHDRRQEELEKFKAPGLVAQKKAYFEEYYRKIRAMKGLQVEKQETAGSDPVDDKEGSTTKTESDVDVDVYVSSVDDSQSGNLDQISLSEKDSTACSEPSMGVVEDENEEYDHYNECRDGTNPADEATASLSAIIAKHSAKEASESLKGSLETAHKDSSVCNNAKQTTSELKNRTPAIRPKGTVASANVSKSDSRVTKDVITALKKAKPNVQKETTTRRVGKSPISRGRTVPKTTSNSTSSHKQVHRSLKSLHTSSIKHSMVPPASNCRGDALKADSRPKVLESRSPAMLSVRARSIQRTSKEATSPGDLSKLNHHNRSADFLLPNKSHQKPAPASASTHPVKEGKQKKDIYGANVVVGRYAKHPSSCFTRTEKASNPKLIQKVVPLSPSKMMPNQSDLRADKKVSSRPRMPIWR